MGAGDGKADSSWRKIIRTTFPSINIVYDCLEPNEDHFQLLSQTEGLTPHRGTFDSFETPKKYHIVLFMHVIHWMENIVVAVEKARNILLPTGKVIIVQQSQNGTPKLFESAIKNRIVSFTELPFFCFPVERISDMLNMKGFTTSMEIIEGDLDVTGIENLTKEGLGLLSFILSTDMRECKPHVFSEFLKDLVSFSKNGKMREDVGFLSVSAI